MVSNFEELDVDINSFFRNGSLKKMGTFIEPEKFQHILRLFNTNIDGKDRICHALTVVRGIGRNYALLVLKKADINPNKKAGELTDREVEQMLSVVNNPLEYKIPIFFLNRFVILFKLLKIITSILKQSEVFLTLYA